MYEIKHIIFLKNYIIITCSFSDRSGRTCVVYHAGAVGFGSLNYNSFSSGSISMFNILPTV